MSSSPWSSALTLPSPHHLLLHPGDETQVLITDGTSSLHGKGRTSDELATFTTSSALHNLLHSSSSKAVARVENVDNGYELRIAARWGLEFGLHDVLLDVFAASLQKEPGSGRFLHTVFERIIQARQQVEDVEQRVKSTDIELEDLKYAHEMLQKAQQERAKLQKVQAYVDILNDYKRHCGLLNES